LRIERAEEQNAAVATRFSEKTMRHNSEPEIITMDKRGANKAAIDAIDTRREFARLKYASSRLM
jgi:transposase-like protein